MRMTQFSPIEHLEVRTATSVEDITKNIIHNLGQGHEEIYEIDDFRDSMPVAIVGGGPTLKDHLDILRRYKFIMACGSVHDYLFENGIVPTWCIICDPDPLVNLYLKKKDERVKYLVASQCSQETFDFLKDHKVYIWHAAGSDLENTVFGENKVLTGGGCTVGTRALFMVIAFGFRSQHLFGFDTCLSVERRDGGEFIKHHAYDFQTTEEDIGDIVSVKLGQDSPTFKVAGYMLGQLFDFKALCKQFPDRINVAVFGDGLLKYLVDYGNAEADKIINEEK